ncbi:MAG: DinB family protein [Anaerolineaceae bacterium]|nr:DinB family protein [Anaerolineaceae bacterium]MCB9101889.1 DinB family protein [Anaerolineales bacterium]
MLNRVNDFIQYYASIRRRTMTFIQAIPADNIDWAPAEGEFTFGDLIRHLAAAEAMFVSAVVDQQWRYAGHTAPDSQSLDQAVAALTAGHDQAIAALGTLPDERLAQYGPSLEGAPVRAWRLLMAMVEHEVHHRSQLAMYLTLNNIKPPHIYGLGVEDVIARVTG